MFLEVWKRENKEQLEKLEKVMPHIEPSKQFKKISKEIAKKIDTKKIKVYIGGRNEHR